MSILLDIFGNFYSFVNVLLAAQGVPLGTKLYKAWPRSRGEVAGQSLKTGSSGRSARDGVIMNQTAIQLIKDNGNEFRKLSQQHQN